MHKALTAQNAAAAVGQDAADAALPVTARKPERLTRRAEFLAAATGVKVPAAAFVLQARDRGDAGPPRFGFTASKKVGNAVERNRVKRRLREIVRQSAALSRQTGHDYVLIGRRAALDMPFARLAADFAGALKRVGKRRTRGAAESTT